MILSNVELQAALDAGRLIINPEPQPRKAVAEEYCPYDAHSVDLTLGPELSIPTPGPYSYDLMNEGVGIAQFISKNSDKQPIDLRGGYALPRNTFILAKTRETIGLPIPKEGNTCLAARVEGKSSRARCGILVHFTAPTIHPGFAGTLTLEIINLGPVPFVLRAGMPIAQLIVEEVKGVPFFSPGQFQGQNTPEGTSQ